MNKVKNFQILFSKIFNKNVRLSSKKCYSIASTQSYTDSMRSITNLKSSYATTVSEFGLITKTISDLLQDYAESESICYSFPHQGDYLN